MNVGEVAASATGDQDFLPYAFGSFDYRYAASAFARFQGAHQACGTAAEHQRVKLLSSSKCGIIGTGRWIEFRSSELESVSPDSETRNQDAKQNATIVCPWALVAFSIS